MKIASALTCAVSAVILAPAVYAWGLTGHQIVATIAQTQLHSLVREHLCTILPNFTRYPSYWPAAADGNPRTHCHLAVLAGWPDTIRMRYPWSPHLHYVNPLNDNPPSHCTFGDDGWATNDNLLYSMVNYTSRLTTQTGFERDFALRFLVHLFGDAHQPLHLTGKARGANDIIVRFEGRRSNLHSVWDSLIINKHLRELSNYTTRLPSGRIESALVGKPFDAYIRWILREGLGQPSKRGQPESESGWFKEESQTWTTCGDKDSRSFSSSLSLPGTYPSSSSSSDSFNYQEGSGQTILNDAYDPRLVDDTDLPVCPYYWTKPMHRLVCQYAFASPVPDDDPASPKPPTLSQDGVPHNVTMSENYGGHDPVALPELDVPEYIGKIDSDKVIQRQLAKAGVRLAAVLNTLLLDEASRGVSDLDKDLSYE